MPSKAITCLPKQQLQRVHPIGMHRNASTLSMSPLSLSQNSNDGSVSSLERKISLSLNGLFGSFGRKEAAFDRFGGHLQTKHSSLADYEDDSEGLGDEYKDGGEIKRCSWVTKSSEEYLVSFHDEGWGVPVYDDNNLFELLSMSGMLIDHGWADIIQRRDLYREVFGKFDPNCVAKMEEKDVIEIGARKDLLLAESRVRSFVENARCIQKVVKEFGSFSGYIWSHVNHKPTINNYKHPRRVPIRTPKAEAISKDLVRRGFRLVGPVIVYSFMQAAGMVIDHLVSCFRYRECIKVAERSWGITSLGM